MRSFTIGQHTITDDAPSWVCAEIGNNAGGNVDLAKQMIKAAAESGVSAVKFQKRDNKTLYAPSLANAPYVNDNSFGATYLEHREAQEFEFEQYQELKDYAERLGLVFFATAFDNPSANFLDSLDVALFKVASGDLCNTNLLRLLATYSRPVIVSTGGGTIEDVDRAHQALGDCPHAFLHCTAEYPLRYEDANLRAITTLREAFPNTVIGFSSHEDGIDLATPAYEKGARIHEQHFTTSHTLKGSDNPWSLEPEGMKRLVRALERTRIAQGDGVKRRYEGEEKPLLKMEKSIFPREYYPAGHTLRQGDLEFRSPGDGIPPYKADKLYGRKTRVPLEPDKSVSTTGVVEP